jgi:hypothetical protein
MEQRRLSKIVFFTLLVAAVFLDGCATHDVNRASRRSVPVAQDAPRLLAVYMPWFGAPDHANVGYSSHDPDVIKRQIDEARGMGVTAFVVDWYADRDPYLDTSFALLQKVAAEMHFHVALMYDESQDDNGGQATDESLKAFRMAYDRYIGPAAPYHDTYLTYNGRPVIFLFPKQGHTNWDLVRQQTNNWAAPPLIIYKDDPPEQYARDFDGSYPWVHPSGEGWSPDGSDWGKHYLETFYDRMKKTPEKLTIGGAWPGFDDSLASWGLNRHMDPRCGRTLEETMQMSYHFRDDGHQLPFLLLETWNDYEEGTALEHRSFVDCKNGAKS